VKLTVDPVEFRGLKYHTGVCCTVYAIGHNEELGRGGRYLCGDAEPATGLTIYPDAVLRAAPQRTPLTRIYIPLGENGAPFRAEGHATVAGLVADADPRAEAERLSCSHIVIGGALIALAVE
jgi:ATP phosphoribosyltransferase regulatory subunit